MVGVALGFQHSPNLTKSFYIDLLKKADGIHWYSAPPFMIL